jgi:hypothetical protein
MDECPVSEEAGEEHCQYQLSDTLNPNGFLGGRNVPSAVRAIRLSATVVVSIE